MEKRFLQLKKWFNSELNLQQKIVVLLLVGSALVAMLTLIGFISPTISQGLRAIFSRADPEWVYGNASDYLPGVGELPAGFQFVESESGPIALEHGDFYRSTFINPGQEQQNREVKVLYSAGVYQNIEIASDAYKNFSDPGYYAGNTINKVFPLADFTNVDAVATLLSQDMNPSGAMTISYTLVFRYRNFTASVTANAPVRDFFDEYAMQLQGRLKNAVIYYAALVINKLPVDQVGNLPQPPFGEIMISTKSIQVEPTRGLLLESTYTPGP
jgi:hypothetical protein